MKNPLNYINSWPTVAAIGIVCASLLGMLHILDADGQAALLGTICMLGTIAAGAMRAAFAVPKEVPKRIEAPRASDDDDDDDGGAGGEVLADDGPPTRPIPTRVHRDTTLAAPVSLALLLLVGCTPSTLQTHATIGTVASVTVRSLAPVVPTACSAALTACTDDACAVRVAGNCRAAATAFEAARDSVHFYLSAIEVAALAEQGAVLPALRAALVGLADFWTRLREGLAPLGVALPPLPPAAVELIAGAL